MSTDLAARKKIDEEQDEQLERVVMFEDIRNILVSITSEEALCWLIGHFLEFCNMPLSNWYVLHPIFVCCTRLLFFTF